MTKVPYDPEIQGERRKSPPSPIPPHGGHAELNDIWNLLRDLDKKVDLHLQEEEAFRPKMVELVSIMDKSKGAITLIKIIVAVAVPVYAAVIWAKDHIKL